MLSLLGHTSVPHVHPTLDKSVLSTEMVAEDSDCFEEEEETLATSVALCYLGPSSSRSYCRLKMHSHL